MLLGSGSGSLDQDHAQVIKKLNECYSQRSYVLDFCELVSQEDNPIFLYRNAEENEELAFIAPNKELSHPRNVLDAVKKAKKRVYFGSWREIDLNYCTIDNNFYYWKSSDNDAHIYNKCNEIIFDAKIGYPDNKSFYAKNVKCLIILATNRSIHILPLSKDEDEINPDNAIIRNNLPFECTAVAASQKGDIFAGSQTGDVYEILYKVDEDDETLRIVKPHILPSNDKSIQLLSYLNSYFPNSWRGNAPIRLMEYDDTTHILAAVMQSSAVVFFYVDEKTHKSAKVYKYEPVYEEVIVRICKIPISDSERVRFVAFTENGDRLFFSAPQAFLQDQQPIVMNKRRAHPPFLTGRVVDAYYALGATVFVTKEDVTIAVADWGLDAQNPNPRETLCTYKLESVGLSVFARPHVLCEHNLSMFKNAMLWQHVIQPPQIRVITCEGVYEIRVLTPGEQFARIVRSSQNHFSRPIGEWLSRASTMGEGGAAVLLIAGRFPELKRQSLFILSQFARLGVKSRDEDDRSLRPGAMFFVTRLSLLLEVVWNSPIFEEEKKEDKIKFKVAELYEHHNDLKPPNDFVSALKNLQELIREYLVIARSANENLTAEQQQDAADETNFLNDLGSFIGSTIATITFIGIIRKQKKSAITTAIEALSPEHRTRLTEQVYGAQSEVTVFEALRDFATKLMAGNISFSGNQLASELRQRCPSFFNVEDEQLINALDELRRFRGTSPSIHLEKICETIMRNIMRPINLGEICARLVELKHFKGVIDVALRRASVIDPTQLALTWFKGGRLSTDELGCTAFNKRYHCYEEIFRIVDEPHALDMMLARNDELFHICLYQRMIAEGRGDKLLTMNTPFLVAYLEEFSPELLWDYHAQHKEYAKAAVRLLEMATEESSAGLESRIQWLVKVANFALGDSLTDVRRDAQHKLRLAHIQKALGDRDRTPQTRLLDQQKLLEECCARGHWDLVLQIVACCQVATDNKQLLVSQVWANMMTEQFWNEPMEVAAQRVVQATADIKGDSYAVAPDVVVPVLEEFKMNHRGPPLWAEETLVQCGARPDAIAAAYLSALDNRGLSHAVRCDYTYAVAKLSSRGASIPPQRMEQLREWFAQNGRTCPYYNDAFKLLASKTK